MTHDPAATLREIADEVDRLRAELDDLRAARMDPDPAEAADVHLCNAIAAAHDGNPNLASSEATKALACLGLDSAFSVTVHRAEKAPPPEPAASGRVRWAPRVAYPGLALHVDGLHVATATQCDGVWTASTLDGSTIKNLPDERTAKAVLLAMVGEDPGATVALSLRDSWTREDVDLARDVGLGDFAAPLLEVYAEGSHGAKMAKDPEVIRQWVAGGQGLMTLHVVGDTSDDIPF